MLEWCRYLLERGCKVDVISTDKTMVSKLRAIPDLHVIDFIYIPRDIRPVDDVRAFVQICSLLRREGYDVVHTYTETPGFIGRMAARFAGTPVILNHQGGWPVNKNSPLLQKIVYTSCEYLAILASSRNICVSHAEAQLAHELRIAPRRKLVTIVNGMNPDPFISATRNGAGERMRKALRIPADHLVIGNTGRLVPGKGNEILIRAMACLKSMTADVPFTLLLAGDGTDRQMLEEMTASLGIRKHVRFLGFVRDVPAFLAGIDIFVTPTLSEGLSISLLEAMATARPIVATSIPSNCELIEHGVNGLLAPVNSPERIAREIASYVRRPDLARQCGTASRKRVLEYYTLKRMFMETWGLYIDLLGEKLPDKVSAFGLNKQDVRALHTSIKEN